MRRVYLLQWGQCVAHDKVPSLWAAKIFSKGVPLCGSKKQTQTLFAACGGNHLGCPAHHWGFFPVPKLFAGGSPFLQRLPRRVIGKREPRKPGGRILLSGNLPCPWTRDVYKRQELLYLKFLQGVPLVGAVGGVYDAVYMKQIAAYAGIKYRRRYLQGRK